MGDVVGWGVRGTSLDLFIYFCLTRCLEIAKINRRKMYVRVFIYLMPVEEIWTFIVFASWQQHNWFWFTSLFLIINLHTSYEGEITHRTQYPQLPPPKSVSRDCSLMFPKNIFIEGSSPIYINCWNIRNEIHRRDARVLRQSGQGLVFANFGIYTIIYIIHTINVVYICIYF